MIDTFANPATWLVLMIGVSIGCTDEKQTPVPIPEPPPSTDQSVPVVYFPEHDDGLDLIQHWPGQQRYREVLSTMHEPSLYEAVTQEGVHEYRLLWIHVWLKPIALRLVIDEQQRGTLTVKMLNAGYDSGLTLELSVDQEIPIPDSAVAAFLDLLRDTSYWTMPVTGRNIGLDGAHWVLEGVRDGEYHVVDRWGLEGILRKACRILFEHSQLDDADIP